MPAISPFHKKQFILLAGIWILVQATILYMKGITLTNEASVYIGEAEYFLQHGHFAANKAWFSSLHIFIIVAAIKFHTGFALVVVIQLLVNAWATFIFYKLCFRLSGNTMTALLATAILLLFIPLQIWNSYLYADSLFISFSILFIYRLLFLEFTGRSLFWLMLSFILICICKPAGTMFFIPLVAWLVCKRWSGRKRWWGLAMLGLAAVILFLIFINGIFQWGGSDLDLLRPYIEGQVVCFVPDQQLQLLNPDIQHSPSPLADLFYFFLHNPGQFLKLWSYRFLSFFILAKPWYSATHNLVLYAITAGIYGLAIWGITRIREWRTEHYFLLFLIVFQAAVIAFQCDDWHSRFTMVVMPYILYFAAKGIRAIIPSDK